VPVRVTVTTGVVVAVISALLLLSELAELVNVGTLFAFLLVAIALLVLRRTRPDLPAGLPRAGHARRPDDLGARLLVPDTRPPSRDLGAVPRLDGDRSGRLRAVRAHPLASREHPLASREHPLVTADAAGGGGA
jgi:hypothetical protein